MEELLELRELLLADRVADALLLVEEMTEMSKDDKLNKIFSFGVILLLQLIKQAAEQRSTRSRETSILNAVKQIQRINQRRKAGGTYLTLEELRETLEDAYSSALRQAALEAFEGRYEAAELAQMVEQTAVIDQAIALILNDEPVSSTGS
jgi:transposase